MPLLQLPTEVGFDHDDPIEASQGNSAENQLESIHPFQIKFSMNPSTAKCSKATPAAVKRDTGKSLALLQCCCTPQHRNREGPARDMQVRTTRVGLAEGSPQEEEVAERVQQQD